MIKLDLYDEEEWDRGIYSEVYMIDVTFNEVNTHNFRVFVIEKNNFYLEKIF